MEKNKLVSVCIPAYNREKHIAKTLEGIRNQTYKNIEIIVGDNASEDNTINIVKQFMEKDDRIRYIKNEKNLGIFGNYNVLVNEASAEYIAIFHSDDIYEPTIIEEEIKLLSKHNDLACVFTQAYYFDSSGKNKKKELKFLDKLGTDICIGNADDYLPHMMEYGNFFHCPSLMVRKTVLQELKGFSNEYKLVGDFEMWLRMLLSGYSIGVIRKPLTGYREHDGSATSRGEKDWYKTYGLKENNRMLDTYVDKLRGKISEKNEIELRKNKAKEYSRAAYLCYKDNLKEKFYENKEKSKNQYMYPLMSKWGMRQRIPIITFGINEFINNIGKCFEKKPI